MVLLPTVLAGSGFCLGRSLRSLSQGFVINSDHLFRHLGRAGILTRRFPERPDWLRFGLPGDDIAWDRLRTALGQYSCLQSY